jgi:cytochrome c oxidase subunit 3
MATIDLGHHGTQAPHGHEPVDMSKPYHERYHAAHHYIDREHEFDAVKMGVWLFLATEILLFSGMFVGYAILRMWHPEAFIGGSGLLDVKWGLINTIVLLFSSYTVAAGVRHAQTGNQKWLRINIAITFVCGLAFLLIKFIFEYAHKIEVGLLPGKFYHYPAPTSEYEPLWWGIYWGATGIHASHVIVGMGLFAWLFVRARKGHFGPNHYNAVEGVGLYWHIVDIVWIFLFPMLYLIH